MINSNDSTVKLEGTGLELLADYASIVASLARNMIYNFDISEKYTREKLHEILDIAIDSIKNERAATNDFN